MTVAVFTKALDYIRGGGDYAISVPPFDGALRPNERIEEGQIACSIANPDNLVRTPQGILFSADRSLLRLLPSQAPDVVHQFASPITALAATGEALAIGLEAGGVLLRGGPFDGLALDTLEGTTLNCATALAFEAPGVLIVANGSARHRPTYWKYDLMDGGCTGSIWRIDLGTGRAVRLADRLAYPYGLLPLADGSLVYCESWRHRLVRLDRNGGSTVVLADLPAYPARLEPAAGGGGWLALFAPRRRMIEFVLREPAYRRRMMAEIPSEYWIAPSLAPMASFLESLQGGTLKKLARLKPWAPTASYGLVVRLDAEFRPVASLHSRGDGARHGIRSVIESDTGLLVASAGAGAVVLADIGKGD